MEAEKKYATSSNHPDTWDEEIYFEHRFESLEQAVEEFEKYKDEEQHSDKSPLYLVEYEANRPCDEWRPSALAEALSEAHELHERMDEEYRPIMEKHYAAMIAELKEKTVSRIIENPFVIDSIQIT